MDLGDTQPGQKWRDWVFPCKGSPGGQPLPVFQNCAIFAPWDCLFLTIGGTGIRAGKKAYPPFCYS